MALFGHPEPLVQPTAGCTYAARVSFDWGDRRFQPDEDFPHLKLGVSELRAFELWSAGLLKVKPVVAPAKQPKQQRKAG